MIGRILGLIVGAAIAAFGYGLWKPATFAKYVDLSHVPLGPFGAYETVVAFLIMVVGVTVALAALQRKGHRTKTRPTLVMEPEPAPAHAEPEEKPFGHEFMQYDEPAAEPEHDDHGHPEPAHH